MKVGSGGFDDAHIDGDDLSSAMMKPPEVYEANGEEVVDDHMDGLLRFERNGDDVRLWFRDANDAVLFKLTYA